MLQNGHDLYVSVYHVYEGERGEGMRLLDILSFYYYANVYTLNDIIKEKNRRLREYRVVWILFGSARL